MSQPSKACLTELPRSGTGVIRATEVLGQCGAAVGVALSMNDCLLSGRCHVIRRVFPGPEGIFWYTSDDPWRKIADRLHESVFFDGTPRARIYWLDLPKEENQ